MRENFLMDKCGSVLHFDCCIKESMHWLNRVKPDRARSVKGTIMPSNAMPQLKGCESLPEETFSMDMCLYRWEK